MILSSLVTWLHLSHNHKKPTRLFLLFSEHLKNVFKSLQGWGREGEKWNFDNYNQVLILIGFEIRIELRAALLIKCRILLRYQQNLFPIVDDGFAVTMATTQPNWPTYFAHPTSIGLFTFSLILKQNIFIYILDRLKQWEAGVWVYLLRSQWFYFCVAVMMTQLSQLIWLWYTDVSHLLPPTEEWAFSGNQTFWRTCIILVHMKVHLQVLHKSVLLST